MPNRLSFWVVVSFLFPGQHPQGLSLPESEGSIPYCLTRLIAFWYSSFHSQTFLFPLSLQFTVCSPTPPEDSDWRSVEAAPSSSTCRSASHGGGSKVKECWLIDWLPLSFFSDLTSCPFHYFLPLFCCPFHCFCMPVDRGCWRAAILLIACLFTFLLPRR